MLKFFKKLFCKHKFIHYAQQDDENYPISFYVCKICGKREACFPKYNNYHYWYTERIKMWTQNKYDLKDDDVTYLNSNDVTYLNRCFYQRETGDIYD